MTRIHTCDHCGHPIPRGSAVLRSRSLRRVAFHRECYGIAARLAELVRAVHLGVAA